MRIIPCQQFKYSIGQRVFNPIRHNWDVITERKIFIDVDTGKEHACYRLKEYRVGKDHITGTFIGWIHEQILLDKSTDNQQESAHYFMSVAYTGLEMVAKDTVPYRAFIYPFKSFIHAEG